MVVNTPALLRIPNPFQNLRRLGYVRHSFAHAPPAFHALFVDQQSGSNRYVGITFAVGVQQAELANDLRAGIAEHGELLLNGFLPNGVGMFHVIHADGNQVCVELVEGGFLPRELAQLDDAERSPIAAVEDDEDAMALVLGEVVGLTGLVG